MAHDTHVAQPRAAVDIADSVRHEHTHCGVPKPILDYGGNLRCLAPVRVAHTELELCACGACRFVDVLNDYVQPHEWNEADELSLLTLAALRGEDRAQKMPTCAAL
jgi:hypothetical protein